MKVYSLEARQSLPISISDAWKFFSDPSNLAEITPPSLGFRIISPLPKSMYEGLLIEYRVTPLFGIPIPWLTEITHVREPFYFVDEQRMGPYRLWHHEHSFSETSGGIEMIDRVHYALFFDPLSRPIHATIVRPQLERIFSFRRKVLEEKWR